MSKPVSWSPKLQASLDTPTIASHSAFDVRSRLAAHPCENRKSTQPLEHVMRLFARKRRDADADVFEKLDQNAAKTAEHYRAEKGIALDAEDHLNACARHPLHEDAINFGDRSPAANFRDHCVISISYFGFIREFQRHSADIALMGDLR